jgi:hypothetical protein
MKSALRVISARRRRSIDEPTSDGTRVVISPKLGSVEVAIPAARLPEFEGVALSSTFYLALSPTVAQ